MAKHKEDRDARVEMLEQIIIDLLDGVSRPHDIQRSTGLNLERCNEISAFYKELSEDKKPRNREAERQAVEGVLTAVKALLKANNFEEPYAIGELRGKMKALDALRNKG